MSRKNIHTAAKLAEMKNSWNQNRWAPKSARTQLCYSTINCSWQVKLKFCLEMVLIQRFTN